MRTVKIELIDEGLIIEASAGEVLGDALSKEGLIELPCGGRGLCGQCIIEVYGEVSEPTGNEVARGLTGPERLACQTRVLGDVKVRLKRKVFKTASARSMFIDVKVVRPLYSIVKLEDLPVSTYPHAVLASAAIKSGGKHLLVIDGVGAVASTDKGRDELSVLLVDVGTTKIAYQAIRYKGEIIDEGAVLNPQFVYGSDVMTRLAKALKDPKVLSDMRAKLEESIRSLINKYSAAACLVAGNSTMESMLVGAPLNYLAERPYQPLLKGPFVIELDGITCYVAPMIGGHVGGDAFMNLAAAEYLKPPTPYMIVDLGTNTEVILVRELGSERLVTVASAPAGPAFEGHIGSGVSMTVGGITHVKIVSEDESGRPVFEVKGSGPGIMGSGLVSLMAELVRKGYVSVSGRIVKGFVKRNAGKAFIIREGGPGEAEVLVTQRDIREFQKAMSAVKTSWELVLKNTGVEAGDLKLVFLSGNFGSSLDVTDALYLHLIPPVNPDLVVVGGNMVLTGLRVAYLDKQHLMRVWEIAEKAKHIDLAEDPEFSAAWIRNLNFR